jgi:thiamine-monophosphate kinase
MVDADRTAASSGCAAEIWLDALPVDPELPAAFPERWVDLALGGGEDFELLIAAAVDSVPELLAGWPAGLAQLRVVGRLVAGSGVTLLEREGGPPRELPSIASRHYR